MSKFKDFKQIGEKYGVGGQGNWMNLEDGSNKIRIVSDFEDYGEHFDDKLNRSFICLGKEKCEYCKQDIKPRVKFKGWVIDRKDNLIKVLTIGYKIHEQIGLLSTSEEYGFDNIPGYDITITKSGIGKATKYGVLPDRKDTPLTEKENEEIDKLQSIPEIIEESRNRLISDDLEEKSQTNSQGIAQKEVDEINNAPVSQEAKQPETPVNQEEKIDVKDIPF